MTGCLKSVPNALSLLRLALSIPLMLLSAAHLDRAVFAVYCVASATDLFDGYLAKKLNAITRAGSYLDPLADKVLLLCCLVLLMVQGSCPTWFFAILLSTTLLQTIGLLVVKTPTKNSIAKFSPLRIGKWNSFVLCGWIGILLADQTFQSFELIAPLRLAGFAFVASLQVLVFFRYCLRSRHLASRILLETGRRMRLETV